MDIPGLFRHCGGRTPGPRARLGVGPQRRQAPLPGLGCARRGDCGDHRRHGIRRFGPGGRDPAAGIHLRGIHPVGRSKSRWAEVFFTLLGEESFSYAVMASHREGAYSFSGVVKDLNKDERPVTGDSDITVSISPPPTPTPSPVPTPTPSPTASPTPVFSPTPEPTPIPTATDTPLPSPTPEPTETPSPLPSPTPEPTATPSPLPSPTPEPTATPSPTATASPPPTPSATPGVSSTPEPAIESSVLAVQPTASPTPKSVPMDRGTLLAWAVLLTVAGTAIAAGLAIALARLRRR